MPNWALSDFCTVDTDSPTQEVIVHGEATHLPNLQWEFLLLLIAYRRSGQVLTKDILANRLWGDLDGWDGSRQTSLTELLKGLRKVVGSDLIGNRNGVCFLAREVQPTPTLSAQRTYFERLWSLHVKGHNSRGTRQRELIDYFVLPTVTQGSDTPSPVRFAQAGIPQFLVAGSGFGKSTLLDMLLLCCLAEPLSKRDPQAIAPGKAAKYAALRDTLFGPDCPPLFPVFLSSDCANSGSVSPALKLAEGSALPEFEVMVASAHRKGRLLFLIDSLDEVTADRAKDYFPAVAAMLRDYPNARVVLASRYLGKQVLPFEYDLLSLGALPRESIQAIAKAILPQDADRFLGELEANRYLLRLAQNPFMLLTILDFPSARLVHRLLGAIVDAVIRQRWDKHSYNISDEDLKLLLGFLACKFIFTGKDSASLPEIRQYFAGAGENLTLYGVPYEVPKQNIEYFLKTLSSQSGILNIVSKDTKEVYDFQEPLVMCWLAANYLKTLIGQSEEIQDGSGPNDIAANVCWLDQFIRSLSPKERCLSQTAVHTLVLTLVMHSDGGRTIQKSILTYLLCRDAVSLHVPERAAIAEGYRDILENAFGENEIANRPDSDFMRRIKRMQGTHPAPDGPVQS